MQQAVLEQDPALELAAPADLPDELEAATAAPLLARDAGVEWLHQRWEEARAGAARLVVVAGPHGMGKTRLAAEVACEAHRTGAAVVYAACERPARACLDSLAAARSGPRPLLVVADGVDRAGADVVSGRASVARAARARRDDRDGASRPHRAGDRRRALPQAAWARRRSARSPRFTRRTRRVQRCRSRS